MNRLRRVVIILACLLIPACATRAARRPATGGPTVTARRVQPAPVAEADPDVKEARFGFEQARLRREEARARAAAAARSKTAVVPVPANRPAK